jgi:hypothetical protein
MENGHGLEFLTGPGAKILQEVKHQLRKGLVRRRGAEEILEATLRQRRLRGIGVDEGNARALGSLACRGGHGGEVGPENGVHLLLCDEALGLTLADLGLALVVDDDEADLGSA